MENSEPGRLKILFVSSSGGHLAQLTSSRPWWEKHERRWVTFDVPDARGQLRGETLVAAHHPTTRSVAKLALNAIVATRELVTHRPDVIVSTGAAVAVPFFVLAKLMHIATVYIEVIDRVDSATVTGKICYRLTKNFCVQLPEQLKLYPRARVIGPLL